MANTTNNTETNTENRALVLDGKIVRDEIRTRLRARVLAMSQKPVLAIIQIGKNPESEAYIQQKKKFGESIGAEVRHIKFPDSVAESEVIAEIVAFNQDDAVQGILVQIPIPNRLDKNKIIETINPKKDVDGLTSANVKKLWSNISGGFVPATAKAVITLLDHYHIPLEGKQVVIIGRSELVGKPLFLSFINRNATVTLCHSKTKNLSEKTRGADILVVAAGNPQFITAEFVSPKQTVIDVGINVVISTDTTSKLQEEIETKQFVGDVDFEKVKNIVSAISPVPGGVGPLTVASLFENLVQAAQAGV